MKRFILLAACVLGLAVMAASAHADQAPSPPTCGANGSNHMASASAPQYNGSTWTFTVSHDCPVGKNMMGEIQVCDVSTGCSYVDVQGIHSFDVSSCDQSHGTNFCNHTFSITVPCSDPNGTKQWRAQGWWNDGHVTGPIITHENEC